MLTVRDYHLLPGLVQYHLPRGAKVLSVEWRTDLAAAFLYFLVDTNEPGELRGILALGTGMNMDDFTFAELGPFVGTVSASPQSLHVFEVLL